MIACGVLTVDGHEGENSEWEISDVRGVESEEKAENETEKNREAKGRNERVSE